MFRFWLAFVVVAPSIALAQTPLPLTPKETAPVAEQVENDCTHLYPPAAYKIAAQGVTMVSVHITADGWSRIHR